MGGMGVLEESPWLIKMSMPHSPGIRLRPSMTFDRSARCCDGDVKASRPTKPTSLHRSPHGKNGTCRTTVPKSSFWTARSRDYARLLLRWRTPVARIQGRRMCAFPPLFKALRVFEVAYADCFIVATHSRK